jgi:VCBS repeat-containing protein
VYSLNVWDGSAWSAGQLATSTGVDQLMPGIDVAFEGSSGDAIAAYGVTGSNVVHYRTWSAAGAWSADQSGPSVGAAPRVVSLSADPYSDRVMLSEQDGNSDLYTAQWSGSAWGTATAVELNTGATNSQPFAFVWSYTANQPPIATANAYTTTEGVAVSGNAITDNTGAGVDSDPDGDPLAASLVSGPLHGTLVLNSNGSFAYTPYDSADGTNFASADSFTYQVSDGKGGTSSAVVSLTVTPNATNEAPVHAVPGPQTVGDVSTLMFSQANGNRIVE